MNLLALDIGSSSVKAAILRGTRVVGKFARVDFATRFAGVRAEIEPDEILRAVGRGIRALGNVVKRVDAIAPAVMSPAWVAMNKHGKPLTPIVTHQDRRSVEEAHELERRIGKARHLRLAGNRPFPGGISSTTCEWFRRKHPALMKRADLVGHLNTFLHLHMTGARVIDPSNASFTGLYRTLDQRGWSEELCENVGVTEHQLPQLISGDGVGGMITRAAGRTFGLTHGTPMLVGMIDTSAAMLLTGARPGQLLNVSGSTDVLGLCSAKTQADSRVLTRALGVGKLWMSVMTLAAAGAALKWVWREMFRDLSEGEFFKLVDRLSRDAKKTSVKFDPYLAGERTSMESRAATFRGLTLSTTREEMLSAVIDALARASAMRLDVLREQGVKMLRRVVVSGGGQHALLRREWNGKWEFCVEKDATLRGLGKLIE